MQLQVSHISSQDGSYQFKVVRLDGGKSSDPVTLVSPKDVSIGRGDKKLLSELRWYLEEYLDMPLDVHTERSKDVQKALRNWGKECFEALFTGHARDWFQEARRGGLENLQLKISSDDPAVLSWPWEALYCDDDKFLAQRCCIERQLSKLGAPLPLSAELPQDEINILYVIPRPFGDRDVGFQTLARPLIDYVHDNKLPVHIHILRPPTFEQLRSVLRSTPNFYHIVHFDGHGGYDTQGELIFEDCNEKKKSVKTEKLSQLLAEHRIPIMILNACQSAMLDEKANNAFASVAASLLQAGIRSVVAMSYSLYVSGAKVFVPDFYQRLFETGNMAEAIRAGRQAMYNNENRFCFFGEHPLQDWIVPMLYQNLSSDKTIIPPLKSQTEIEDKGLLPKEVLDIGDYRFIGRERMIHTLERAVLRQDQAGLLIHGMAGIGKTTLAKGFLHWLNDTNGLENQVVWFDFRDIRSFEYIVNKLVGDIFETNAIALPDNEKLSLLIKTLKDNRYFIVWDNFESASGIDGTEVKPQLTGEEKDKLKNLLKKLRGGKTKILITSRAPENWLTVQECYRVPLGGMRGEEVWEYCNAVVKDLGLRIERNNKEFAEVISKLDGNPLAIRAILLRLEKRPLVYVTQLLAELDDEFKGFEGDESTQRIQAAFNIFNRGLDEKLAPILQLIGLHEHYVVAGYLEYMLKDTEYQDSCEYLTNCFTMLENAGFCHEIVERVYKMHPALRSCLTQTYPALETLQREFVGVMGSIANKLAPKELHEQRNQFMLNEANFYRAMNMAPKLEMEIHDMALTQALAAFMQNNRNFYQAAFLLNSLAEKANKYNNMKFVATAYHQLGMIAEEQRDFQAAEKWYEKTLEIELKQGNEYGAASTYHQLGIIAQEQREFQVAEKWHEKTLEINLKQGNEYGAASAYHQLGIIAQEQRDFQAAKKWYEKALEINLKRGNEYSAAMTYHQLGMIAEEQRDFQAAEKWYEKTLEIDLKHGNEHGAASTYHQLGMIAEKQRNFQAAKKWYEKALEIKLKQGNEHGAASTYHQLGNLYDTMGENEISGHFYIEALKRFIQSNDEYHASVAIENFVLLLQSSDNATQEKLRKLWIENGLDPELLNKTEEKPNEHK
ncbi:MAG: tetratricopeptide repeat protein [Fibromonadaceae bacterium]|jgi:tetratricopeptide (TPR) repeat protein|nr:tetratricopeptide repeat protein [Fibromonadaceae bacterium]